MKDPWLPCHMTEVGRAPGINSRRSRRWVVISFSRALPVGFCRKVSRGPIRAMDRMPRSSRLVCMLALAFLLFGTHAGPSLGADYSISAFGTIGHAVSDQPFKYDRLISDRGTFRRDTVTGLQFDSRFTDSLGATIQFVTEVADDDERQHRANVAWAFLSWRPTSDWLFRLGKQRLPLYLYSQTFNVGVTYDFARPPIEMYSISPNNDYVGASFSKTWNLAEDEILLEGIWANTSINARVWTRDDIAGQPTAGTSYRHLLAKGLALSLSYKRADDLYRAGLYRAALIGRGDQTISVTFPFVTILPGIGYYQPSSLLPGPGVPQIKEVDLSVMSLGADINIGSGYRLVSEFARTVISKTEFDETANRGYISLVKRLDRWTPYIYVSAVKSTSRALAFYNAVNSNSVPAFVPGAPLINASQRAAADQIRVQDQYSTAIGVSYRMTATQILKAEIMRVRIGKVSSLVDAPSGGDVSNERINVFSLSYSFAF